MTGTLAAKSELSESGGFLEQPLADHLLLHGMRWHAFLNWTCDMWLHPNGFQIRDDTAVLENNTCGMA